MQNFIGLDVQGMGNIIHWGTKLRPGESTVFPHSAGPNGGGF